MSLLSRYLEGAGIPTVILGSAWDIVEYCGVPRFLYTDFPLGNPCGQPGDSSMQADIVARALSLLETATAPGRIVETPYVFTGTTPWRDRYLEINDENREMLRQKGEARRAERARLRAEGKVRTE